ncbi:RIMS-binding protein 2-like isoform X3 [Planococcus citri]|uniref:RIMS-binding protein 2-like isoform X3 n=1 Tax=Planococcus citri TaxID=170843 RepID=UPI0031F7A22C
MRDVSERKKELEKEQAETLSSLRDKQNELQWRSNCSASEKVKICETIEALQSKIRELEKKMELQNVHHEELLLEMAAIKRTSSSQQRSSLPGNYTTSPWKKPNASNQEVQTSPESNASELNYLDRLTPSTSNSYDSGNIYENRPANYRSRPHIHGCPTNIAPSSSYVDLHLASLDPSARYSINTNTAVACKPYWSQSEPPCTCPVSSDQELTSATPSNESACSDDSGIQNVSISHNSSITVDIDKIMAKIDQDNRILAELDKTRSTIVTQGSMTAEQLRHISDMGIIPPASCQGMLPVMQSSGLPMTTSQTTINPPISLSNTFPSYLQQYDLSNSMRPSMGSMFPMQMSQQMSQIPVSQSTFSILQSNYPGNYSQMSSNLLQSQFDLDARVMKNGNMSGSAFASTSDLLLPHEDLMMEGPSRRTQDMVEIPGKGLCNIFISKYSYDPFSQSTSICPEAELAINAGDYLLVYGEPDDDGYVDAELMDGRRGLVPIMFIQKLSGDELLEFNQRVLMGMKEGDDSASTTIPQDIETVHIDEHGKKFRPDYNLGGTTEEEEDVDESESDMFFSVLVPAPKQLTLERQLNKSILIRWNAPEDSPTHCIDSYHVYVDGVLKTTIKANERTKALLEGVDSNKPHRISVRSVTQNRRTSRDAACTMLIGKDVPCYPTNVKAHHVTPTSAVISWMPSNSNYQHTVCVNNVEVRTVKPGVYRHTITGLVPNTIYRVTVRAKNIRAPQFDDKTASDKYASHIDFRTLPKGMPDPPSEIQVEVGPQDGTLLVTWIPVMAESANGAPVTGYAVYADGKKVTDIDSPTGDHALIDISKIISMNPRNVTVRTKSKENQSCDSNATPIPSSAIKARHHSSKGNNYGRHQAKNAYGQVLVIDPEENLSDKEVYPGQSSSVPAIEITKENLADENYSEEEFLETHRSNRNIRYNQPPPPRSHGPPRSHLERGRPPPPHSGHERVLPRPNYDVRSYDMRRDNREYHHSPARSTDRRTRVMNDPHMKPNRGPTQSQASPVNRQHPAPATATPDDKSRLVVALFDYDPSSMSPNPATSHEELAFSAGDQIKILSEKDPDGFYWGECHGKQGYVPQNMITDLENAPKHTRYPDIHHNAKARKMIALYDYDPHENSPNLDSDAEISFSQGQIIYVKGEPDDDGFYLGEVDGMQGLVPSNYLQEIDEYQEDDRQPPHARQTNRGVVRPIPQRDQNRGHGPGARGPPPPPRDGMPPRSDVRDRRKDARPQYENQQDQIRNTGRTDEGRHLDRRMGRELPSVKGDHYGNMPTRENNTSTIASNLQNNDPNRSSFRTNRTIRGTPNVIPELSANKPTNAPPSTGTGLKFPESPNIMQKLSEITHNAENPVDNILSKGKELIFMKFGLGK